MTTFLTRSICKEKTHPFINDILCDLLKDFPVNKVCARPLMAEGKQIRNSIATMLVGIARNQMELEEVDEYYIESDPDEREEDELREQEDSGCIQRYNFKDTFYRQPKISKTWNRINCRQRKKINEIAGHYANLKQKQVKKFALKTQRKFKLVHLNDVYRIVKFHANNGDEFSKQENCVDYVIEKFNEVSGF